MDRMKYNVYILMMMLFETVRCALFTDDEGGDMNTTASIYYAVAIAAGLAITFYGYRLFRPLIFLAAFYVGAVIAYMIAHEVFEDQSYRERAEVIAALVGGVVLGAVALSILRLGIFLIGAAAGATLGQFLTTSFLYKISEEHADTVMLVVIIIGAIVGGVLALAFHRPILILFSSWIGAVTVVRGIGYFAGKYPMSDDLRRVQDNPKADVPDEWWVYFVATILLFIAGVVVQHKMTAKNINHTDKYYRHRNDTGRHERLV